MVHLWYEAGFFIPNVCQDRPASTAAELLFFRPFSDQHLFQNSGSFSSKSLRPRGRNSTYNKLTNWSTVAAVVN